MLTSMQKKSKSYVSDYLEHLQEFWVPRDLRRYITNLSNAKHRTLPRHTLAGGLVPAGSTVVLLPSQCHPTIGRVVLKDVIVFLPLSHIMWGKHGMFFSSPLSCLTSYPYSFIFSVIIYTVHPYFLSPSSTSITTHSHRYLKLFPFTNIIKNKTHLQSNWRLKK